MIRPRNVIQGVELFAARTPTLPPATHTNSYALGDRDVLLVEPATPYDEERRAWLEWARSLVAQGRRLVALFLTHHHGDHVGGAGFLAAELGLELWAHRSTADRLRGVSVARCLEDGESIVLEGPRPQRWNVLHTPGHAPGHLCLHEPSLGQVLVGDMVASTGTIVIAPDDGDMAEYLVQLRRLESLAATTALPAHGDPIHSPGRVFSFYVAHRLEREKKVLAALRAPAARGGSTPEDLVPIAYDDTPRQAWGLAALSVASHLDKLCREGRAKHAGARYHAVESP